MGHSESSACPQHKPLLLTVKSSGSRGRSSKILFLSHKGLLVSRPLNKLAMVWPNRAWRSVEGTIHGDVLWASGSKRKGAGGKEAAVPF